MDRLRGTAQGSKEASYRLQSLPAAVRNDALKAIAEALQEKKDQLVAANMKDLAEAEKNGLARPLVKRLKYDEQKVRESISSLHSLVAQEDPIGHIISRMELDDGLVLDKVSCPIGVIGVIFEARPEALVQISSLCLKSGNAVILKGGSEARNTNIALAEAINEAILKVDQCFQGAVTLLSTREEVHQLLELDEFVDLIIPRGSNELVRSIQESTKIPVLGHAAGICHTYVDDKADLEMAIKVCYDAKVQYPAVCNAMETLLVNENIVGRFLPPMAAKYEAAGVELRGDQASREIVKMNVASIEEWDTEYNDLILSIKVVRDIDDAIRFINKHGSHHSDAIVTNDVLRAERFMNEVDSSSVMWNASTRFADGYRYGLGAEVGISTNKTHARGPVGLEGLIIYKWKLFGKGHVVNDYVGPHARQFTHRKLL